MDSANASEGPQRLGDFEIIRELGRGGMGVVYEATQKSLNRRVALKVLSTGLGLTTKAIIRFKREAEAAAKLHHTNIVPIYATGEENRTPYYAMELIDGPSLDHVIRHLCSESGEAAPGPVDSTNDFDGASSRDVPDWVVATIGLEKPASGGAAGSSSDSGANSSNSLSAGGDYFDNIARMMADVANALAHAHEHGVIHRDIKPSNLLLSDDGRLSVNDFGLARMLEQPGMTISGELMGSPMYMSPEQVAAGRLPLDHRTDIYSLGATLYELLTLRPPFDGRQRDQVLSQIVHKEPTGLRTINKRIPKDLETICLKAMEKDPDRRYPTAGQLSEDLHRFISRHAISARRIGTVGRAVRWARRRPALAATIAALLVVLATAGALAISNARARIALIDDHLRRGREWAMAGNFETAREYLEELKQLNASEGETELLDGLILLNEGDAAGARRALLSAKATLPNNRLDVLLLLATAQEELGRYAESELTTHEIQQLGLEPKSADEFLFKAMYLFTFGPSLALELLEEGVTLDESGRLTAVARLQKARILTELAKDRGSRHDAEIAVQQAEFARELLGSNNALVLGALIGANLTAAMLAEDAGDEARRNEAFARAAHYVELVQKNPKFDRMPSTELALFTYYSYGGESNPILQKEAIQLAERLVRPDLGVQLENLYLAYLYGFQDVNPELIERLRPMRNTNEPDSQVSSSYLYMLATHTDKSTTMAEYLRQMSSLSSDGFLMIGPMYVTSVLYLLDTPIGEVEGAYKAIKERNFARPWARSDWYDALLSFNCGEINKKQLEQQTGPSRYNQAEAYIFIGLNELCRGNRKSAEDYFRKCVSTRVWHWSDYGWSRAFLARMESDNNWPSGFYHGDEQEPNAAR